MLQLKRCSSHEWEFVHPDGYGDTMDELHRGCELYEEGDLKEAERVFKAIVMDIPDHLDGLHHWALVREEVGDLRQARSLWEKAVAMGKKAFPKKFTIGKDLLPWGFLDNRPFLRCMHGLALCVLKEGDVILAQEMFMDILKLNPNDNQGVRELAVESFLCLCQPDEVLKVCDSYPYDTSPGILYDRALAHFQLGNRRKANKHIKEAIAYRPKVAKEIVKDKHRKPRSSSPGYITVGGDDEAYDYWQRNKTFWKDTPGAIDWLKAMLPGTVANVPLKRRPRKTKSKKAATASD